MESLISLGSAGPGVAVLADAALKGTLVLLIALLATRVIRRSAAAARHAVWTAALCCQLSLPFLAVIGPRWQLPVLPAAAPAILASPSVPAGLEGPAPLARPERAPAPEALAVSAAPDAPPGTVPLLALVWLSGCLIVLLRLAAGTGQVLWLARRAERVTCPAWLSLAQRVEMEAGLRRPLTLLRGTRLSVPVTWGILYPVVLLPADAEGWDPERRRIVLVHEVAHVRRWDALTQLLSQIALALFWFNPLVWIAIHRMRMERERACDSVVLGTGTRPSEYVDHLIEIVRSLRPASGPAFASLAMARRSEFEGRMLAVLDADLRHRSAPAATAMWAGIAAVLIAVPLAGLRPVAQAAAAPPAPAGAAAAASGGGQQPERGPSEEPSSQEYRWSGHVAQGRTIEVKGTSGNVLAVPGDGPEVEVVGRVQGARGRPAEVRFEVARHAGGITLCAVYPSPEAQHPNRCVPGDATQATRSGEIESVDFVVRVPRGVRFTGRTVSGDVAARGVSADVALHTVSGDVELATSGSGEGSTVSGEVRAAVTAPGWAGRLSLRNASGDVRLELPADTRARVSAGARSGTVRSDFPLGQRQGTADAARVAGTLGDGRGSIDLETVSGSIRIVRSGSTAPAP